MHDLKVYVGQMKPATRGRTPARRSRRSTPTRSRPRAGRHRRDGRSPTTRPRGAVAARAVGGVRPARSCRRRPRCPPHRRPTLPPQHLGGRQWPYDPTPTSRPHADPDAPHPGSRRVRTPRSPSRSRRAWLPTSAVPPGHGRPGVGFDPYPAPPDTPTRSTGDSFTEDAPSVARARSAAISRSCGRPDGARGLGAGIRAGGAAPGWAASRRVRAASTSGLLLEYGRARPRSRRRAMRRTAAAVVRRPVDPATGRGGSEAAAARRAGTGGVGAGGERS